MTDVGLINLPSRVFSAKYRPPIAYMYMAAYAEREGVKVDIVDIKPSASGFIYESYKPPTKEALEKLAGRTIEELKRVNPLMVGISCFSVEYQETIDLARRMKKELPGVLIVVGGVHPTIAPNDFIFDGTPIDFVVIGEGEETLTELVKAVKNNQAGQVKGVWGYDRGRLFKNSQRRLIENIDDIPLPAFNKVDMSFYTSPNPFNVRGIFLSSFLLLSGRGCPYNCTFCASKAMRKQYQGQNFIRFRNIKSIVDEIELVRNKYFVDAFYFLDDTFTMKEPRVLEFCDELKKRNLNLLWGCSTRVNLVSEKMLAKMRQAGCVQIDFGVESGSVRCLEIIKKGITLEQVRKTFAVCRRLGIRTLANFMFNIPDETETDVRETFSLIDEIKPTVAMVGIVTPYPGTDIYETLGPKLPKEELNPDCFDDSRITIANTDSRFRYARHDLDLAKLQKTANRRFNTLWSSLAVFFDFRYIRQIIRSKRKKDYLRQVFSLAKIWLAQRKII